MHPHARPLRLIQYQSPWYPKSIVALDPSTETRACPARRISRTARTVVWCVTLVLAFTATHIPPPSKPIPLVLRDKTLHVLGFTVLGFLTLWRLSAQPNRLAGTTIVVWFVGLLAYGAFDELTQPITGRSCEFGDWLADSAGAAIGFILALIWHHYEVKTMVAMAPTEGRPP